jgi:hypothetical protein
MAGPTDKEGMISTTFQAVCIASMPNVTYESPGFSWSESVAVSCPLAADVPSNVTENGVYCTASFFRPRKWRLAVA